MTRKRETSDRPKRKFDLSTKRGAELVRLINGEDLSTGLERKYQARYLEVLMAAANQFASRGYQATSTGDIAAELGIRQSGLYYYINSKEAALEQICEVAIDGYVAYAKRINGSDATAVAKLRSLIRAHLSTLEKRPTFFTVFQENRKDLADEARHRIGQQIREYERQIEQVFDEGIEAGAFRSSIDSRHAMLITLAACNAASTWIGTRIEADIDEICRQIGDLVLNGVVKQPAEPERLRTVGGSDDEKREDSS